ncbi:unnamed protein product [Acanthoscelides obtectus]|uniref:Uncharacterized protein n=1 Tax=Acanthoscelides obtectus TaxID=200917 RepID=A0A9P0JLK6_ACAOB|nr:unnamed protein product [Acanthoscelides obtectus]CAK1654338.1 hypothetical protein AOBTE_LOCUS18531 [Acanthoscelides obtectus]
MPIYIKRGGSKYGPMICSSTLKKVEYMGRYFQKFENYCKNDEKKTDFHQIPHYFKFMAFFILYEQSLQN